MQHFAHEEGRIRTNNSGNLVHDYFIKDHLGNTRMTLTEEQSSTIYLATMESEYSAFEESLFLNLAATRDSTVTAANYTQDISTQEDKTARLNGNIASRRVGPAKLIAVSPGDSIDMEVFAYFQNGYTNSGNVGQSNVISAVAAAFGGSASAALGSEARSVYELFNTNAALTFVGSSGNSALPKAYLNYILFDQDFNDIAHDYIQVGSATNTHQQLNLGQKINQGGYIYVWLSNESQTDFNVYFDDLRVTHTKGAILQEDHYYPFGLTINALSSSAPLSKPNKFKYNGNEEQTEFDLNLYDFNARMYDSQLGRFNSVDPLAEVQERWTPYHFSYNNPMTFSDPTGLLPKYNWDTGEYEDDNGNVISQEDAFAAHGLNAQGQSQDQEDKQDSEQENKGLIDLSKKDAGNLLVKRIRSFYKELNAADEAGEKAPRLQLEDFIDLTTSLSNNRGYGGITSSTSGVRTVGTKSVKITIFIRGDINGYKNGMSDNAVDGFETSFGKENAYNGLIETKITIKNRSGTGLIVFEIKASKSDKAAIQENIKYIQGLRNYLNGKESLKIEKR